MIYLKSVSSYLDDKKGIIYTAFSNNTPDTDLPISLVDDEVSSDWIEGLSREDYLRVEKFL